MLISRNLILQGFLKSGSKSCKPEVTFAIHRYHTQLNSNNDLQTKLPALIMGWVKFYATGINDGRPTAENGK